MLCWWGVWALGSTGVHDWLVMSDKGEGVGITVCVPEIGGSWPRIWQQTPKCFVFKPKDDEKTDTSCLCCILCLVFTFKHSCFSCYRFAIHQRTGILRDGAWLKHNLTHKSLMPDTYGLTFLGPWEAYSIWLLLVITDLTSASDRVFKSVIYL